MLIDSSFPPEVRDFLAAWRLFPDGPLLTTHSSWVLPVQHEGSAAVLKVARTPGELLGYRLLTWWDGQGAAKVFASSPGALLMERARSADGLAQMAWSGQDDAACRILCDTAARLSRPWCDSLPDLHPLEAWFQPLFQPASDHAVLGPAADTARRLLASPEAVGPLHGDLHHENVLDFGERGWLAIDPHGLLGERTFDYAKIFTNPDLSDPSRSLATLPGRLEARLDIVIGATGFEPQRLLRWIVASTGLSAAWFIEDGDEQGMQIDLAIGVIARRLLDCNR